MTESDINGKCPIHPVIQLKRKHRITNEWKVILNVCPLCASNLSPKRVGADRGDRGSGDRVREDGGDDTSQNVASRNHAHICRQPQMHYNMPQELNATITQPQAVSHKCLVQGLSLCATTALHCTKASLSTLPQPQTLPLPLPQPSTLLASIASPLHYCTKPSLQALSPPPTLSQHGLLHLQGWLEAVGTFRCSGLCPCSSSS